MSSCTSSLVRVQALAHSKASGSTVIPYTSRIYSSFGSSERIQKPDCVSWYCRLLYQNSEMEQTVCRPTCSRTGYNHIEFDRKEPIWLKLHIDCIFLPDNRRQEPEKHTKHLSPDEVTKCYELWSWRAKRGWNSYLPLRNHLRRGRCSDRTGSCLTRININSAQLIKQATLHEPHHPTITSSCWGE
jgi:hypothetical protein